jgi:hypothetical protein
VEFLAGKRSAAGTSAGILIPKGADYKTGATKDLVEVQRTAKVKISGGAA